MVERFGLCSGRIRSTALIVAKCRFRFRFLECDRWPTRLWMLTIDEFTIGKCQLLGAGVLLRSFVGFLTASFDGAIVGAVSFFAAVVELVVAAPGVFKLVIWC